MTAGFPTCAGCECDVLPGLDGEIIGGRVWCEDCIDAYVPALAPYGTELP